MSGRKLTDVEREFALNLAPGMDLSAQEHHSIVREAMAIVAHHEAGHVVTRSFTLFEFSHIVSISIIGNTHSLGRTTTDRTAAELMLSHMPGPMRNIQGNMMLLEILAGRGAEIRFKGSQDYEEILDPDSEEWEHEGTDLVRSSHIAKVMSNRHVSPYRILTLATKWTIEMLDLPNVWEAVEKIAQALIQQGTISDQDEIYDLIEDVKPAFELPKWRRRLVSKRTKFSTLKNG